MCGCLHPHTNWQIGYPKSAKNGFKGKLNKVFLTFCQFFGIFHDFSKFSITSVVLHYFPLFHSTVALLHMGLGKQHITAGEYILYIYMHGEHWPVVRWVNTFRSKRDINAIWRVFTIDPRRNLDGADVMTHATHYIHYRMWLCLYHNIKYNVCIKNLEIKKLFEEFAWCYHKICCCKKTFFKENDDQSNSMYNDVLCMCISRRLHWLS